MAEGRSGEEGLLRKITHPMSKKVGAKAEAVFGDEEGGIEIFAERTGDGYTISIYGYGSVRDARTCTTRNFFYQR